MKNTVLFAAVLIALGALPSAGSAVEPASAGMQIAGVSDPVEASVPERREGIRRHRGNWAALAGPGAGIARLDTDGDGRISREEAELGTRARGQGDDRGRGDRRRRGAGIAWLLENFDAIDANGDGHIVRSELRQWNHAQRSQREAERERRFQERFSAADVNGDGRLSPAEVDESMPRLSAVFAWMDEDGDGFLSPDELRPQGSR